jgi:hypothetical protein
VPKERYHRAEEQLHHRDRISSRSVDDCYSESCRGVKRDVVDSDARPTYHFQLARILQQVGRYTCGAAPNDRVVVGDAGQKLVFRQCRYFVDDELRLSRKDCHTFGIDLIGDENTVSHYSEPDLREGRAFNIACPN